MLPEFRSVDDVAQRLQEPGRVVAEGRLADRVQVDLDARPDLALHDLGVSGVGVVGAELVGLGQRRRPGEDVPAGVLRVGRRLDRVDQLGDLVGDRLAALRPEGVVRALDDQVADAEHRVADVRERGVGHALPRLRLGDVSLVLAVRARRPARSMSAWLAANGSSDGAVSSLPDEILLLRLRELVGDVLEVEKERPREHVLGDSGAHSPTFPVRVDELVDHLVHRGERTRGRLVAALELDEVRHLLVERDARDGLALVVERAREDGRVVGRLRGVADVRPELRDELRVGRVDGRPAEAGLRGLLHVGHA